jgi:hypothetical protein
VQSEKQEFEICRTDEGIEIDRSDEQSRKAQTPRIEMRQWQSNVKQERPLQPEKHLGEMARTDEAI